jgi:hypothetical protein
MIELGGRFVADLCARLSHFFTRQIEFRHLELTEPCPVTVESPGEVAGRRRARTEDTEVTEEGDEGGDRSLATRPSLLVGSHSGRG